MHTQKKYPIGCYNKDGNVVTEQNEIEEAILDHFGDIFNAQRNPTDTSTEGSDTPENPVVGDGESESSLETKYESRVCAPMTMVELEALLEKLPNEKSPGYDQVPGFFFKELRVQV